MLVVINIDSLMRGTQQSSKIAIFAYLTCIDALV